MGIVERMGIAEISHPFLANSLANSIVMRTHPSCSKKGRAKRHIPPFLGMGIWV